MLSVRWVNLTSTLLLATCLMCAFSSTCQAHFLWVVDANQSADGKVHVYFSEEAAPDNPALLEKNPRGQTLGSEPPR